jgi:hypothetical protein
MAAETPWQSYGSCVSSARVRFDSPAPIRASTVARAVVTTIGRPLFLRIAALGTVVTIGATILFAGQGLRARDLVLLFHASLPARLALWTGWTLMATPVLAPVFDAPGTLSLRTLRPRQGPIVATILALASVAELPWVLLFARGASALQSYAMTALALAIQLGLIAARARPRALGLAAASAALAMLDPPPVVMALPASVLAVIGAQVAWRHGLERRGHAWRLVRPMPAVFALAALHALLLVRAQRTRLSLSAMIAAAGGAFLALSLANDPTDRPIHRGTLVMALPLTFAASALAPPILRGERRLAPWLRSLRIRASTVFAAFFLALATPSSAMAATAGAIAAGAARASPWALAAGLWLASLASTSFVAVWARVHDRSERRSPVVFVLGVVAVALAMLGAASAW